MISVIVPVYNVEKYLNRCIDSIINQTYTDLEIILVDDGSTDSSGSICDEYAQKDERIKVIHKENGGLSDARNTGVAAATGDYVSFIDSDDYIEPDMMELLITTIGDCDMSMCGMYHEYPNHVESHYNSETMSFKTDGISAFALILEGRILSGYMCNRLIKSEIVKKLRFPKGKIFEDMYYNNELMPLIKDVYINTKPMYHYLHRENSITKQSYSSKNMDLIYSCKAAYEMIPKYPQLKKGAEFRYIWSHFDVLDRMLLMEDYASYSELKSVVSFLRKHYFKIITNNCFGKGRQLAAAALLINVKLYRVIAIKKYNCDHKLYN